MIAPQQGALLRTESLSKAYGPAYALHDASFTVDGGETVALLGQNGAGKSTIVKILAGVIQPTSGTLWLAGEQIAFNSPRSALKAGIALIPQELAYVPPMSVAENIMLGDRGRYGIVRPATLVAKARPFAEQLGLEMELRTPMHRLSLAQRQLVEIAKALRHNAKVLLLDEPTAALSNSESMRLFSVLDSLRQRGTGLVYISHRLDEVLTQTDRAIVLRDGRVASERCTRGANQQQLIADMLGRSEPMVDLATSPRPQGAALVEMRQVARHGGITDISTTIHAGEIVGLFGIRGSGPEEVTRILAGLAPHHSGRLLLADAGTVVLRSVRQARALGISYVPSDRKKNGVVLVHGVRENLGFAQLSSLARCGIVSRRLEHGLLERATSGLGIQYRDATQPVRELSGGNQQKVLLAGRIYTEPRLLVIDEPSRGVDVAARADIHLLLKAVAHRGAAVVFASSDVEECVALSDRLLVFREGQIVADLSGDQKTQSRALGAAGQEVEMK